MEIYGAFFCGRYGATDHVGQFHCLRVGSLIGSASIGQDLENGIRKILYEPPIKTSSFLQNTKSYSLRLHVSAEMSIEALRVE